MENKRMYNNIISFTRSRLAAAFTGIKTITGRPVSFYTTIRHGNTPKIGRNAYLVKGEIVKRP